MAHLSGTPELFEAPEGLDLTAAATQQELVDAQVREYEAKLTNLKQQRIEREQDLAATTSQLSKLRSVYGLINQQVTAREPLVEKGWSPKLQFLELKERQVTFAQDIQIQKENLERRRPQSRRSIPTSNAQQPNSART